MSENRWLAETGGGRGEAYAERFAELARSGVDVHGEADFVSSLVPPGASVLDAGCGTGRVGIELHRRGYRITGVDVDESMLAVARRAAPGVAWLLADLATLDLADRVDLAVLAGNVMVYLAPGTEAAVVSRVAAHLVPGGLLVSGFQTNTGLLDLPAYDGHASAAGLEPLERWATWDRAPFDGGDYAVSVHRRPAGA